MGSGSSKPANGPPAARPTSPATAGVDGTRQQRQGGVAGKEEAAGEVSLQRTLAGPPEWVAAEKLPWPGPRAAAVVSDIAHSATRAHYNAARCVSLAQACCDALVAVVDANPAVARADPVGHTRVLAALLEALEAVRCYVHTWSQPGWLKAALDEPPKAVTAEFEAHCARLDLAPALGIPHSEALKLALSSDKSDNALGVLLPRMVELAKEAATLSGEDRLSSDWQQVQGMWAAVDASGFAGETELAALAALLGVGEATLSEEVTAAQVMYAEGAGHAARRAVEGVIAHPIMRALWTRTFQAEKVSWATFWDAFPSKLAGELEADPDGALGLGGLMGEMEAAEPMRRGVEEYVGAGRGRGLSIADVNALFPAGCRIGERVAQLRAALDASNGVSRLAGERRIAGMPADADGLFFGHKQARADLRSMVSAPSRAGAVGVTFLTGPSGVGKSALARTIAKDCLAVKSWTTAYYVDLDGCQTMADAAHRMCFAFQVPRAEVLAASGTAVHSQGDHGRLLMWLKAWSERVWGSSKGRALTGLVLDNADALFAPPNGQSSQTDASKEGGTSDSGSEAWALLSRMHQLAPNLRSIVVSERVVDLPDGGSAMTHTVARVGPLEAASARELLATLAPPIESSGVADALVAECGGFPVALRAVAQTVANGWATPAQTLEALTTADSSHPAAVIAICLQLCRSSPSPTSAQWLPTILPLTLLPATFTAEAAMTVLNASSPPSVDDAAEQQRRFKAVTALRQHSVRGLLQEADCLDGRQRWRMLPALRTAIISALRPSDGDFMVQRAALVRLLSHTTATAQLLFHERAAGWAGAAAFEPVAPLVPSIVSWITSIDVDAAVWKELAGVVTTCRALLSSELPRRQLRQLAEAVAQVVGSGTAKLGAAWALSREGKSQLSAARALAAEALRDIEGAEGESSSAAAEALVVVGELAAADGDLPAAETAYQRCLMLREALMGPHHTATARCQNNLGGLHARAARWKDAELGFRSSLHAFQALLGESSLEAAMSMSNLGRVMFEQGELEEADGLLHSALAIERRCLAPDAPPFLTLLSNLTELLDQQQRFEEADTLRQQLLEAMPWGARLEEQELQHALDKLAATARAAPAGHTTLEVAAQMKLLHKEAAGEEELEAEFEAIKAQVRQEQAHQREGGPSLVPFNERAAVAGDIYTSIDELDHTFKVDTETRRAAMVRLAQRRVDDVTAQAGRDAPELLPLLQELGQLQYEAADFEAAEETCRRVQALTAQVCGPLSAEAASASNNLAVQLHCQGRYGAARPLYNRALSVWEQHPDTRDFHSEIVDVLCNLSRVSRACGDLDQAQAHIKSAIDKEFQLHAVQTPDIVAMKLRLAELLEEDNKEDEVEQLLRTTAEEAQQQLGADHWEVALLYGHLAALFTRKRHFTKAEAASRMAAESRIASAAASHVQVADRLQAVAAVPSLQALGFDPAPLLRVALHLRETAGPRAGGGYSSLAKTLNLLGNALKDKGQYAEAEPCFRRALEALEKVAFPDPYQLANAAKNLADMLDLQGKLEEAEQLYWRFLENRETQLGAGAVRNSVPDSMASLAFLLRGAESKPDWVVSLLEKSAASAAAASPAAPAIVDANKLNANVGGWETGSKMDSSGAAELLLAIGAVLEQNRMASQAETLYRAALAIRQLSGKGERAEGAAAVSALGVCVLGQGRLNEADKLLRQALTLRVAAYGKDHWLVATSLNNLGTLLSWRERWEEAEKVIRQALNLRIHTPGIGPYHPLVAATLKNLASLLHARGDWAAAEPLYQRALEILSNVHGPNSQEAAQVMNNLGMLMERQRNFESADIMLTRCLEIRRSAGSGPESPYASQIAATLCNIGHLRVSQDDLEGAEEALLEALRIYEGGAGRGREADWATAMHNYSVLLRRQGRWREAEPVCRSVVEMRKRVLGEGHSQVGEALSILAGITQKKGLNAEAESMYRNAVALMEKQPAGEDLAYALRGLARLEARKKAFDAAQATYTRCLQMWEDLGYKHKHPVVQVTLLEMAETMKLHMEAHNASTGSKLKMKYGMRSSGKVWKAPVEGGGAAGASTFTAMAKSFRRIVRPSTVKLDEGNSD